MPDPNTPKTFSAQLPWPPSTNNLYRTKRGGGVYMKGSVKDWYDRAVATCRRRPEYQPRKFPEGTRVRVTLKFVPPTNRKYDIDNRVKAIYDCLQRAQVFDDDDQVFQGVEHKFLKDETGQFPYGAVFVLVEPLPPETGNSIWEQGG